MVNDKSGGPTSSDGLDAPDSTDASAGHARGMRLLKWLDFEGAKREFERILSLDPDYVPARFGLGCAFLGLGMRDKAMEEWSRCVEISPSHGEAHYALAWTYYDEQEHEKGYEHLNKAIDSGVLYDSIKDFLEKIGSMKEKDSLEFPDDLISDIGSELEKDKGGVSDKEESAELLYERGLAALREGHLDKAIELLEKAISVESKKPEFHLSLGGAYSHKGDLRRAVEEWRKTLKLDPDNRDAKIYLSAAYQEREEQDLTTNHISTTILDTIPTTILTTIRDNQLLFLTLMSALLLRILYYVFVLPVDFHIDTYHHWQISYFSLKIGFPKNGFFYDPGAWTLLWMPLPHLVQMFLLSFNKSIDVMRIFNIIIGTVTIIPLYWLTYILKDKETALLASIFYAIFPIVVVTNVQALTEPLTVFLLICAFLKMYEGKDLQAGFVWGLACLCRQEVTSLAFIVLLVSYFAQYRNLNRISKMIMGIIPPFATYYLFFSMHRFNPLGPISPPFRRMLFFAFKKIPFFTNYPEYGIILSVIIVGGTIIYCRQKSVKICSYLISSLEKILSLQILPILCFLLIYSIGLLDSVLKMPNFFYKLSLIFMFRNPYFSKIGFFRYSSIPFSIFSIPFSILMVKLRTRKFKKIHLILLGLLVFLNLPFAYFYSGYERIPLSYSNSSLWISENINDGVLIVDNQLLIYQLVAVNDIDVEKIIGSYWAHDLNRMKEENFSMIAFTNLSWDGAHMLFKKSNNENLILFYTNTVTHPIDPNKNVTLYVYKIE